MEQVYKQENNEIIRYLAYTRPCIIMLVTFCHLQRKKDKDMKFHRNNLSYFVSFFQAPHLKASKLYKRLSAYQSRNGKYKILADSVYFINN